MQPAVADRPAGGSVDQAFLQEFADDGGSQLDTAPGVLYCGKSRGNIAGRDHTDGRSRISCRTLATGKAFDGGHLQPLVAFSPKGETGQWLPKVAA